MSDILFVPSSNLKLIKSFADFFPPEVTNSLLLFAAFIKTAIIFFKSQSSIPYFYPYLFRMFKNHEEIEVQCKRWQME